MLSEDVGACASIPPLRVKVLLKLQEESRPTSSKCLNTV